MKAQETIDQQMKDSDMIFTQISGVFDSKDEATRAVLMLYAPDMSISRAGISHVLGRIQKDYPVRGGPSYYTPDEGGVPCPDCSAPQPIAAAEVPMPDIAGELFDGKRVCDEADVRTYGDAREAAGYAAGVAEVRDYAVMRWCAEVSNRPLVNTHRRTLDDTWRQVIRHTGGDPETLIGPCHDVLVALREEVKP